MNKVLLDMVTRYKYPNGTEEELYRDGATSMLGAFRVKKAITPLSWLLFDDRVDKTTRALAAKSLGQIDIEASKEFLLAVMDPNVSDYYLARVNAAESLSQSSDPQVLMVLDRYSGSRQAAFPSGS